MFAPTRATAIASRNNSDCARRSAAEKPAHHLRHRLGLLEVGQMSGLVDELDPRAGNPPGELLRVDWRDDAIRLAPDDQGRCGNAVSVIPKPAVGDRPDELAGAGLRPN